MNDFWISCGHHLLDRDEGGGLKLTDDFLKVYLARKGIGKTPPLFVNQLVHVILRNALDGVTDARVVRAAELFFRTQRVTLHENSLLAADEETIGGVNTAPVTPLVSMLGIPAEAEIDVLNDDNAENYWERSDQFDMAIDLTGGHSGLVALAEAMRRWIVHVLGVEVTIEPLTELRDAPLSWYVGLDADATRIGDRLWNEADIDEAAMAGVIGLFALTFRDPSIMLDKVKGEPVYLILAMTPDKTIRMKPQNLVTGLPIRHLEAVG